MSKTDFITKVLHLVNDLKSSGCKKTRMEIEDMHILKVTLVNPVLGIEECFKVALEPIDNDWHYLSKSELIDKLKYCTKIYKKQIY